MSKIACIVVRWCIYAAIALFFIELLAHRLLYPAPWVWHNAPPRQKLAMKDGNSVSIRYLHATHSHGYTILYSHGNATDLPRIEQQLQAFVRQGYDVVGYDYPGYGLSTGRPSESSLIGSTQRVYRYLRDSQHVPADKIIAYGHSLGAAMSIDLASKHPLAGLVADAGFVSAYRVMTRYALLPFDKYNNLQRIKHARCPVVVMVGTHDRVISPWHSRDLYAAAPEPKRLIVLRRTGHNDGRYHDPHFWQAFAWIVSHPR